MAPSETYTAASARKTLSESAGAGAKRLVQPGPNRLQTGPTGDESYERHVVASATRAASAMSAVGASALHHADGLHSAGCAEDLHAAGHAENHQASGSLPLVVGVSAVLVHICSLWKVPAHLGPQIARRICADLDAEGCRRHPCHRVRAIGANLAEGCGPSARRRRGPATTSSGMTCPRGRGARLVHVDMAAPAVANRRSTHAHSTAKKAIASRRP